MKKILILILILFFFSCDVTESTIHGCLDSQACNYNSEANIDNNSCEYILDCLGECGGTAEFDSCGECGGVGECFVYDSDGNEYETIQIGEQLWMKENLRVTRYRNGDPINTDLNNLEWRDAQAGSYATLDYWYDVNIDGLLYNYYALIDDRGICPEGWAIPTFDKYQTLIEYLGGASVAGGKMKEIGIDHWQSPNIGATNESSFSAHPSGYRFSINGYFGEPMLDSNGVQIGTYSHGFNTSDNSAYFHTLSSLDSDSSKVIYLSYDISSLYIINRPKADGCSVRCLKD